MNPRTILALTVPIVLVLVIVGAMTAEPANDGALDIADELIGVVGVILGGIVSGILVSGNQNDGDNDDDS